MTLADHLDALDAELTNVTHAKIALECAGSLRAHNDAARRLSESVGACRYHLEQAREYAANHTRLTRRLALESEACS